MDDHVTRVVHSYDPEARKVLCGATSQIGSTKHAHDVTCEACLGLLGRVPHSPWRATPAVASLHH